MSSEQNEFKGIPKLTVVTYPAWKRAMVMALMSERCYNIDKRNEAAPKAPLPLPDDELSSTPEAKTSTTRPTNVTRCDSPTISHVSGKPVG